MKIKGLIIALTTSIMACSLISQPQGLPPTAVSINITDTPPVEDTSTPPSPTETAPVISTNTAPPTDTPLLTWTSTPSSIPIVDSLKAQVTADLLSCRYGPGAEYLYLYGLRKGANIKLIGRTDGNNWVWVSGKVKCWVNAKFVEIAGDRMSLPVVYPGMAKLPVSPYYPPSAVTKAARDGNKVTVIWLDIPLRAGDEEDASMLHYIIEVWRCEGGHIIFDPLATNDTSISFIDEQGCSQPSHGRVWVQEKHGFAGPAEIPWPEP